MNTNPWKTLGMSRKATSDEIKTAYRKLVLIHHPDRGGKKETFDELQKAYDILSDPVKRREFEKQSDEKPITKLSQIVRDTVDAHWESVILKTP